MKAHDYLSGFKMEAAFTQPPLPNSDLSRTLPVSCRFPDWPLSGPLFVSSVLLNRGSKASELLLKTIEGSFSGALSALKLVGRFGFSRSFLLH